MTLPFARGALCLLLTAASLACEPAQEDRRLERMAQVCSAHHPLSADQLARLDEDDVKALQTLARDRDRPLSLRARAVSLAGARPSDEVRSLWREMRRAPERELRVQAAWAEGLSNGAGERLPFASALLHDDDAALREVGAHLLAIAGGEGARELARGRIGIEEDAVVRAVLSRKILDVP